MKQLFLVLLVVNALVFLWWQFDDSDEIGRTQVISDSSGSLMLLSEVDGKSDVSPSVVEATPDLVTSQVKEVVIADIDAPAPAVNEGVALPNNELPVADQGACYTVGPVVDQSKVEDVLNELLTLGVKINQRIVQESILIGYRVYIPSLSSVEEARDMLQTLKKQGIKDSVIIRQGEYKNGISLGVFSKQEGAKRHQEAMTKKGFDAKLVDRYRDSEQHWFDIYGIDKEDSLLAEWVRISEKYPEMKKQAINCK